MSRILIVDDEDGMREFLSILLHREGYEVLDARSVREAQDVIRSSTFDLLISDLKMEGREDAGLEVLRAARTIHPFCAMVVLTAYGSVGTAVEAMKIGASDYLAKPFENEELLLVVKRSLEQKDLKDENFRLREELRRVRKGSQLIGQSQGMQRLVRQIEKVAPLDATVLIRGESGTGKELVARAIHASSHREKGPFIPVNCGGIPETLLESELFGHVRGAFTGATNDRLGLFEAASGGTLFLDEISETPPSFQVKLLRVIEERAIKRVGCPLSKAVDARILSATNRDLRAAIKEGIFREDLYYRLNVVNIEIPPLRERREDIPLLVQYFLSKFSVGMGRKEVTEQVMESLLAHSWPGNVRELRHCLENACIMADGPLVDLEHLPAELKETSASSSIVVPSWDGEDGLDRLLNGIEKRAVLEALDRSDHRQMEAAEALKISPRSLRYRMNKHGVKG